jgi:hypothetical protein
MLKYTIIFQNPESRISLAKMEQNKKQERSKEATRCFCFLTEKVKEI